MVRDRRHSGYSSHIRQVKTVWRIGIVLALFVLAGLVLPFALNLKNKGPNIQKDLLRLWEEGSYKNAFDLSKAELDRRPLDYFLLTVHGFSAYQIGVSQINNSDTMAYIDQCIWSLRKALLAKNDGNNGRVYYVLGKAYYYKGAFFADLAVKFLEQARAFSYAARDIPEYLGLAYAALQDYRSSVAAFTLALEPSPAGESALAGEEEFDEGEKGPSDLLLLSIARSYIALGEPLAAKAYLIRCIESSRDSWSVVAARLLFGGVLAGEGAGEEAEAQYMLILEENGENAEAHYQLGELYAARGDTTRARAEWRRAVRIDPAHRQARLRLNI
ncbi:MAG: tetratricopeptide repeat protein [Treponema sp.]|jgi:tetratricopeptide (TPR) repeat protein|nr:tetratricopeptide repeat protein [Treponema sp.]